MVLQMLILVKGKNYVKLANVPSSFILLKTETGFDF